MNVVGELGSKGKSDGRHTHRNSADPQQHPPHPQTRVRQRMPAATQQAGRNDAVGHASACHLREWYQKSAICRVVRCRPARCLAGVRAEERRCRDNGSFGLIVMGYCHEPLKSRRCAYGDSSKHQSFPAGMQIYPNRARPESEGSSCFADKPVPATGKKQAANKPLTGVRHA